METPLSQRRFYKPIHRLDPAPFLRWAALTTLLALLLALLMSWLFRKGWYLVILVPSFASFFVATYISITIHKGKVRWPAFAAAFGFFIGVLLYGGYLYFCMLAYLGYQNASRIDLLPRYIDLRLHTDVQRNIEMPSEKSERPDPVINGIFLCIELALVLLLTTAFGYRRALRTFCEKCNQWKRQDLAIFPPGTGVAIAQWFQHGQLAQLAAIPPYTPTGKSKASTVVALERCDWPGGEQCPVYFGVKNVSSVLGRNLVFDESLGKVAVPRVELTPDELKVVLPVFSKIPAVGAVAGLPAFAALVDVKPVPPGEANKILARRTVLMANAVALCTLVVFFGSIAGCLGAIAYLAHISEPPIDPLRLVATLALIILCAVLAILSGYIGLKNPGVPGDKFYRFRARRWFSLRRNKIVDPDRPSDLPTFFVGMTPRKNWGKLLLECSTDMGFLQIDPRRRELRFEGDVERYRIPVSAITNCGLASYSASASNTRIEYWAVVVQGNTAAGFWEAPFYPRQTKWFPPRDHRRVYAQQILDQIAPMLRPQALADSAPTLPPPVPISPDQLDSTAALPIAAPVPTGRKINRLLFVRIAIIVLAVAIGIWRGIANHSVHTPAPSPDESATGPTLDLRLTDIQPNQQMTDTPPFHAPGGDWTVFTASAADDPQANFTLAVQNPAPLVAPLPIAFSNVEILPGDRQAGGHLVDALAKTFQLPSPDPPSLQPLQPLKLHTAVLGENLSGPREGLKEKQGSWVDTKWFIQNEGLDAEVFFDYNLSSARAAFSEKDSDYDADVVQGLAFVLRDGPRPPRSPQNDPNFTTDGPRVADLQSIPDSTHCAAEFARGGKLLLFWRRTAASSLMAAPLDNPQSPAALATFDGIITDIGCADPDANRIVVEERLGKSDLILNSNDTTRFWWIDRSTNQRRPLTGPWGQFPSLAGGQKALSPNGRYIVIHSLSGTALDRKRNSVLDIIDVQTFNIVHGDIENSFFKGWTGDGDNLRAVAITQNRSETAPASKTWCINPATGVVAPADPSVVDSFDSNLSPDHLHKLLVHPQTSLDVIDLSTHATSTFNFHPDDRRFANADAFRWLSPRYIQFDTGKTTFIDITTMKQGYLPTADRDGQPEPFLFSPDFHWAIAFQKTAVMLGRVALP